MLRGTATVATAVNGLNPDLISFSPLPLAASVGDTFDFQLLIDVTLSPGTPPGYPTRFSAQIGGSEIVDAGLIAHIINDSLIDPRHIAEFIDLDAGPTLGDRIAFFNRDTVTRSSGHLISAPAPAFESQILFTSYVDIQSSLSPPLTSGQVPEETSTWQSFSQRELALSFDNRSYLGAYITTIAVVPEPSTFPLFTSSVVVVLLGRRLLRHDAQGHLTAWAQNYAASCHRNHHGLV